MKCHNADCPCLCDNPDRHHRLAELGGNAEVNPDYCVGFRKTDQLVDERDAARAEVERLREALRLRGQHSRECDRLQCREVRCVCGLDAALAGQPRET